MNCLLNDALTGSVDRRPGTGRSILYSRESVYQANVALLRDTVADIDSRRTCGCDSPDNLRSRECDRRRKYFRQLVMPLRLRPKPTGANVGRPARCRPTRHCDRHGRAYEAHWYGRPPRTTDAKCVRCFAPTMLRTTRRPPERRGNDIILRIEASGDPSSTGLTTTRHDRQSDTHDYFSYNSSTMRYGRMLQVGSSNEQSTMETT
ncbi:hypothetical protein EVAR_78729_1 [Eumeta japonica]|uniref:Uncharacterized protein n=1 Tax=Eumeta variegata TaxID=151549 RepID=A0A4C1T130_EUMVA|nr:hypothetical protein EVAR_78729_1 [Eumeta japonica]